MWMCLERKQINKQTNMSLVESVLLLLLMLLSSSFLFTVMQPRRWRQLFRSPGFPVMNYNMVLVACSFFFVCLLRSWHHPNSWRNKKHTSKRQLKWWQKFNSSYMLLWWLMIQPARLKRGAHLTKWCFAAALSSLWWESSPRCDASQT